MVRPQSRTGPSLRLSQLFCSDRSELEQLKTSWSRPIPAVRNELRDRLYHSGPGTLYKLEPHGIASADKEMRAPFRDLTQ